MGTNKKLLACRVSNETYEAVRNLTEGDNRPFESTTEYLQTLIISDLARRRLGEKTVFEEVAEILQMPEIKKMIKEIARAENIN